MYHQRVSHPWIRHIMYLWFRLHSKSVFINQHFFFFHCNYLHIPTHLVKTNIKNCKRLGFIQSKRYCSEEEVICGACMSHILCTKNAVFCELNSNKIHYFIMVNISACNFNCQSLHTSVFLKKYLYNLLYLSRSVVYVFLC